MIKLKNIINESFVKGFEATRVGKENWVEIFKNPTYREIAECTSGDNELGVILLNNDAYVWNREKALHVEVMKQIAPSMTEQIPLLVYFAGNRVGIYVTDAATHTKWYRQPETKPTIKKHPFFRGKKIESISYWDEDVNGKWVEESTVKEGMGMDSWNTKDKYGHWITNRGEAFDVEHSHEDEAIDIIKNLYFSGTISREEFHSLNIPLNSTSEVENFLFDRGFLRGVIDSKREYLVNGRKGQRPSEAQMKWMKKHGEETKRTVYWCPAGEGQIIGMKTIYSPYDIMEGEQHKNPRLGKCYELAGRYVSHHQDSVLVHGTLVNRFGVGHKTLEHAWVELPNGEVLDPVMDKIWPPGVYEGLFKTKVDKKYTHDELIRIINREGNWGPWDVLKEGDRNTERGKPLPQTGYPHKHVEIFRAMIATEKNLKENDYVTRSKKFAVEHSDHQTAVHEELYHVMRFVVKAEHVFEAWNPGEYFYNGPSVSGTEIYSSKNFL